MSSNNSFYSILTEVVSEHNIAIFKDSTKCKRLFHDYIKRRFEQEICVLLHALKAGVYKDILDPRDSDSGMDKITWKLQEGYTIAKDAAEATVIMLKEFSKNRQKIVHENIKLDFEYENSI